jgi:SnoaL-like domain
MSSSQRPWRFSVEHWAAFWSNPHPELARRFVTPDVETYCPGVSSPVRGVTQYARRIGHLVERLPDLRLEVVEHATNGDCLFVHWVAHGVGSELDGGIRGVDRIQLRDGLVKEIRTYYDPARLPSPEQ